MTSRPAKLDRSLINQLKALADPDDPYETISGKTMCADDFYEGNIFLNQVYNVFIKYRTPVYLRKTI